MADAAYNEEAVPQQGLYICCPLFWENDSFTVNILLDCGASSSLLDFSVYEQIPAHVRPKLNPNKAMIKLADGHRQASLGETVLPLIIGEEIYNVPFIVGHFSDPAILGMSELKALGLSIDFEKMQVSKSGLIVPTVDVHCKWVSRKVVIRKACVIPARSQMLLEAYVDCAQQDIEVDKPLVMEPEMMVFEEYGILPACSLHNLKNNCISVLVQNPLDLEVSLDSEMTLGYLTNPQEELSDSEDDEDDSDLLDDVMYRSSSQIKVSKYTESLPSHLHAMFNRGCENLIESQQEILCRLLDEFQDVYSSGNYDIGRTPIAEHSIDTGTAQPVKQHPRRFGPEATKVADEMVDELLIQKLIEPSKSPWASPIVMVKKKDGGYRMCIDFRELNKRTLSQDAYPLPRIDSTLDSLSNAKWFCTNDLTCGYWQVPMSENSKIKTAFCTRRGLFQWNVLPFGVCAGPATFQRMMESILSDLRYVSCLVFLDDVVMFGSTFEETIENYREFLVRMRKAGLKLKPSKCCLFQKSVSFLGHVVSEAGIATDSSKVEAVKAWPQPKRAKDVRSFLGLVGYYRKFISDFSRVAKPLTALTCKGVPFIWSEVCQAAFEGLKKKLQEAPVLGYPRDEGQFILDTDASDSAIGAVLSQSQDGEEVVLAYASKTLTSAEVNYCVTRRELLAIVHNVALFKNYLIGKKFLIRTDHSALKYLQRFKEPEGQLARWLDYLQQFQFEILHRPGVQHGNADALSRIPDNCGGKKCYCRPLEELEYDPPVVIETHEKVDVAVQASQDCHSCETTVRCCSIGFPRSMQNYVSITVQTDPPLVPTLKVVSIEPLWDRDTMLNFQEEDSSIGPVLQLLNENPERPKWSEVSHLSEFSKLLLRCWDQLVVREGLLYRKGLLHNPNSQWFQLILPRSCWQTALEYAHDMATSRHNGVKRTIQTLKARFWWPKLREFVERWVQT